MSRAPRSSRSSIVGLAALTVVAAVVVACGDPGPTPAPTPAPSPSGPAASRLPAEDLPLPDDDTTLAQVLLQDADGYFDRYASIGRFSGPASCTAVLLDTAASGAAAYALTSAHCVGLNGADEVVVDAPAEGMTVTFTWFVDVTDHRPTPVSRITWASMRGTDLALLELATSPGELAALGIRGWRPIAMADLGGAGRTVRMLGVPVGGTGGIAIPDAEQYLRMGSCSLDADAVVLNERQWRWPQSLRNDCPEVVPGNSGSALLDSETGGLLGIVNTTTFGGEQGAECWLGRPCEVTPDGETAMADTSYAQPVAGLDRCFRADGAFALGGDCPLDAGGGAVLSGAPLAVNPAVTPVGHGAGAAPQTTWATAVGGTGTTHYRYKIGPLASTTCEDKVGYGAPIPVAQPIADALPVTEQRLVLCVIGGPSPTPDEAWQQPAHASAAVAYIDTTAPEAPIRLSVSGDATHGWRIEPVFNPPDLSFFLVKGGPAGETSCTDPRGYTPYRRIPTNVPAKDAPYRFCVIGLDDADNATAPLSKVLR